MNLKTFDLERYEKFQKRFVDELVPPGGLREMMEYSLLSGGKRLRPSLLIQSFSEMCRKHGREIESTSLETAMQFAVGIECIHTYSLIHDDLPCMDDDDYRRGRPTCHLKYGDAEALLAGDALLNLGFEMMSHAALKSDRREAVQAMQYASRCSGASGMVLGQYYDIRNKGDITAAELEQINLYKTSALIRASVVAGVILGYGNAEQIKSAEKIGDDIGMIFQLTDDLIDIHSSAEEAGKSVGSDKEAHKLTYPALLGEEVVQKMVDDLVVKIQNSANAIGLFFIEDTVKKLVGRKR